MVSIHAPVKGATQAACRRFNHIFSFNPRSREGSDGLATTARCCCDRFQSTLP